MSYSNFQDPIGLLKRMVTSGNPVAYFTLFREGFGALAMPLDRLLQPLERRWLQKPATSELPVIFIIGGPRCGTTLLYQTLVQYLPVSYFSNLIAAFPRSPIATGKLLRPFGRRVKQEFRNYYGSVAGFSGPNDGFPIWNRWLGEDRYAVPEVISSHALEEMRHFFNAWHAAFQKPFINKNNRNVLCVAQLASALSPAYVIEIRRRPIFVAQSLLQSRLAVQGSKHIGWGLGSLESNLDSDDLHYVDDVCEQVYRVDVELDKAKALISPEHYIQVTYEHFCEYPDQLVQEVHSRIWGTTLLDHQLSHLTPFTNTNRNTVTNEEYDRMMDCISTLYREYT